MNVREERGIVARESYHEVGRIFEQGERVVKIRRRLLINQHGVVSAEVALGKIFVDVPEKIFLNRQNFFAANAINHGQIVRALCEQPTFDEVSVRVEQSFHRQIFQNRQQLNVRVHVVKIIARQTIEFSERHHLRARTAQPSKEPVNFVKHCAVVEDDKIKQPSLNHVRERREVSGLSIEQKFSGAKQIEFMFARRPEEFHLPDEFKRPLSYSREKFFSSAAKQNLRHEKIFLNQLESLRII